jgi:hypothetical protein
MRIWITKMRVAYASNYNILVFMSKQIILQQHLQHRLVNTSICSIKKPPRYAEAEDSLY